VSDDPREGRVTVLVGKREEALQVWSAWAAADGRTVIGCPDPNDRRTLLQDWMAAALEGKDVVAAVAHVLGGRVRASPSAIEYRLRHERHRGAGDLLDALIDAPLLHSTCELMLGAALSDEDLWPAVNRSVERFGDDFLKIPRAIGELIGWESLPAIVFPSSAGSLDSAADFAARLVDRSPLLAVGVCIDEDGWNRYRSDARENRAKGVLLDGFVRFVTAEGRPDPKAADRRDEALVTLARTRQSEDSESGDLLLRSAAEAILYEALEANAYTRGQFEPNRPIQVVFGTRLLEVDLLGRSSRIALEIDGYYHFRDVTGYRRDRTKDILMQKAGYLVVRILAEDVIEDLEAVLSRIVALVLDSKRAVKETRP
jgi:very-short-patch-repair endonuclease